MTKNKKNNPSDSPIDRLKYYLTLQLEAYLKQDWELYHSVERHILEAEREL